MTNPGGLPFTVNGQLPRLDSATMIVMMTGWIDASNAAAAAMDHIVEITGAETLIEFDPDIFMDLRTRRPTMELREGVNTRIEWPCPCIKLGADTTGKPLLLLTGPEPDSHWKLFAGTVAALARQLDVAKAVGIGAYPYAAPHTRPVGLTATSPDPDIIERLPLSRNSLDVPAGVESVLEHDLHALNIATLCIWAQVPHYVSSMSYPAASGALIEAVCAEADLSLDAGRFNTEAGVQRERLDQLVSHNTEHQEMLRRLELAYDEAQDQDGSMTATELGMPTVDEIAAEVEQFLRDQQTGG